MPEVESRPINRTRARRLAQGRDSCESGILLDGGDLRRVPLRRVSLIQGSFVLEGSRTDDDAIFSHRFSHPILFLQIWPVPLEGPSEVLHQGRERPPEKPETRQLFRRTRAASGVFDMSTSMPPRSDKASRVLACVLCQHRKIKCDRTMPCSNCVKVRHVLCSRRLARPKLARRQQHRSLDRP